MKDFPSIVEKTNDLTLEQINGLLLLAEKFKKHPQKDYRSLFLAKLPRVAHLFLEPSTRTKGSFSLAASMLSLDQLDFSSENSSLKKGEDFEQTLKTLSAMGVDLAIIRSQEAGLLSCYNSTAKGPLPLKLINAGDGQSFHPTQALLDLMTLRERAEQQQKDLKDLRVTIVGDIPHSRVAHDLLALLPRYGVHLSILTLKEWSSQVSLASDIKIMTNLEQALQEKSDVYYLLRVQKERHQKEIALEKYSLLFDCKTLSQQSQAVIFHPGPANIGVEISRELINSSLYWGHHQVRNGVYMRMAMLVAMILNGDKNVGVF